MSLNNDTYILNIFYISLLFLEIHSPNVASISEMSHASSPLTNAGGMSTILSSSPLDQLIQAREILEHGLANINYARHAVAHTDGKNIADVGWVKVIFFPFGQDWM